MSFCFLTHLWICPKHHYFLGLYLLNRISLSSNSIQDSLSALVRHLHSIRERGHSATVSDDDDHTPAFLSPKWKFSKMDVLLQRPSKLSSPNKNSLHKKALRRVAQNKNTLPWLPICPSSSSQNVKPVSSLINISKLGNNAQEGQEPCLAGASCQMLRWLAPLTRGSARSSNQGPRRPSEWYGFASTFPAHRKKSLLG